MAVLERVAMGGDERWIQHYSSAHSILLVGEGDFSFSLSLAVAFGSATNIIATSLDSYDQLIKKYKNAETNVKYLRRLGASLLHGVDATRMKLLPDLQCRRFNRIIYNFPHAGFHRREDDEVLIKMHRSLVREFFRNARRMLTVDGEIHVNHKIASPYNKWKIEDLASDCALFLVELPVFNIKDYPGYKNKRGAGSRCDEPFRLGESRTFKFKLCITAEKVLESRRQLDLLHKRTSSQLQETSVFVHHQPPPLERFHPFHPFEYGHVPLSIKQTPKVRITNECHNVFGGYLNYVQETFGSTDYDVHPSVWDALANGFKTYISSVPEGTWSGYIDLLEELRSLSIQRSEWLRQMLATTC